MRLRHRYTGEVLMLAADDVPLGGPDDAEGRPLYIREATLADAAEQVLELWVNGVVVPARPAFNDAVATFAALRNALDREARS